jgi:hypothetical protein
MTTLTRAKSTFTDAELFLQAFNRLCVALQSPQDESGATQAVYWQALGDLPIAALETAAIALMREGGRRFFPTTGEWRAQAELVRAAQLREALDSGRGAPWVLECERCEDTGWVTGHLCDGGTACGRKRPHLPHEWATPCFCRPMNRTYRRHQAT